MNVIKTFEQLDRETLMETGRDYLDTIRRQMTYEPSRDGVAILLLRSLQKIKSDDPEKSPLYRVCKWLSTHALTGYRDSVELRKAIAKDTNVGLTTVLSIFKQRDLKLPPHLKWSKRGSLTQTPAPKLVKPSGEKPDLAQERAQAGTPSLTLPPNIKELTLKAHGFELTLKFQ